MTEFEDRKDEDEVEGHMRPQRRGEDSESEDAEVEGHMRPQR